MDVAEASFTGTNYERQKSEVFVAKWRFCHDTTFSIETNKLRLVECPGLFLQVVCLGAGLSRGR